MYHQRRSRPLYNVTHTPSLPAANQAVVVTAQAHDPDGIQNLTLYYRLDPATNYTAVPMTGRRHGRRRRRGRRHFQRDHSGPSGESNCRVLYFGHGQPGRGDTFPGMRSTTMTPVRECVVMFGDGNPGGSFGVYHLWITQTNVTRWANLGDLSNEGT